MRWWSAAWLRTLAPFAVVVLATMVSFALPPRPVEPGRLRWFALGVLLATALAVLVARRRLSGPFSTVLLLGQFGIIAWARDLTGQQQSGLAPLVMLPVLWIVLYGRRIQLWCGVVATALVFWLLIVLKGAPAYDPHDWRRGFVWSVLVAVLCPPLQRAVQRMRDAEQTTSVLAARLSAILRAVTEHAVIAADLAGTITFFSEGAERMLRHRAQDVVDCKNVLALHLPEEVAERAAELGINPGFAVFTLGVPDVGAEVRSWTYRRRDGSVLRVRLAMTRLMDDAERQIGWIGVASDISLQEKALQGAESSARQWRTLLEHLPDTVVMVVDETLTYQTATGAALAQLELSDAPGRTLRETASAENVASLESVYLCALSGREASAEIRSPRTGRVFEITAAPLPDRDTRAEALIVGRDVTELRHQQELLLAARDRFERLFAESPHSSLLLATDGTITQLSDTAATLFQGGKHEVIGSGLSDIFDLTPPVRHHLVELLTGVRSRLEVEQTLRSGEPDEVHVLMTAVPLVGRTQAVEEVLIQIVDLSERKRYENELAHLADHDPLTGLHNRRRFNVELDGHLARCRRYGCDGALIILDLDHFKNINDILGHGAGDQLIVSVAEVLRKRLRASDVVSRLGGDEFAILLPHVDRRGAATLAQDIVDRIRGEVCVLDGSRPRRITASVGMVLIDDADISSSELMATADMTMYDAKEAGRDRYVLHDDNMFEVPRTGARIAWTDRIAHALEDGRLAAHAQPVQNLRTGLVSGAELLVRLVDTTGEIIMPGQFLSVAERTGQITDIDKVMITHAVQVLQQIQPSAPDFSIEVNLSGISVGNTEVARHITEQIRRSGIDPRGLILEITETAAVSNIESARVFARQIGALGCRFALDDFGAGFGSFYYLKHLSFDFVKIDGEFVAKSPGNPTDQLILASIVGSPPAWARRPSPSSSPTPQCRRWSPASASITGRDITSVSRCRCRSCSTVSMPSGPVPRSIGRYRQLCQGEFGDLPSRGKFVDQRRW